jgi:pyruvate dehydrogenase E2 component (dihydrolipoamide acetyltransferase)
MKIEMPNLSPTMEKGNLKSWNKKVGEAVAPGDVLAAIETDKAVVDFEMQEEGYVAALLFEEGAQDVPLGEIVAIIVEDEADVAAFADYTPGSEAASSAP